MSIDILQDKIRKLKSPAVVDFGMRPGDLPPHLLEEECSLARAYGRCCAELMEALRDAVPAVRFPFGTFVLMGADGLEQLRRLLNLARQLGFYVLLDSPEILSPRDAEWTAETVFTGEDYPCDGLIVSPYIGSDALTPFLPACRERGKDLFAVMRAPNHSASEIQDLLTGSRQVYGAVGELLSRLGEPLLGKCGYSRLCAVVGAGMGDRIKSVRSKHNRLFLLVDGLEYPSGNMKNCSYAFDRFGHGAAVCVGTSLTAAWKEEGSDGTNFVQAALQAAERVKKNTARYLAIL